MTDDATAVRTSALPGYMDCARRSAARLFAREIKAMGYEFRDLPNGIGASIGTAVHAGAAYTLTEKMKYGSPGAMSAVLDCAIDQYGERVAEGVIYDRETPERNAAERQIAAMVTAYQRELVPHIEPIAVEEQLEADTPFGLRLTGRTDLLAREPGRVRDLKTGKKRSPYKPQIGGYSLLLKSAGFDVTECAEDYLPRVSIKHPQPSPVTYPHDLPSAETAAWAILRHIATDLRTFREGDPARGMAPGDPWAFPANPSSILCGEKWCPCWGCKGASSFCREWLPKD